MEMFMVFHMVFVTETFAEFNFKLDEKCARIFFSFAYRIFCPSHGHYVLDSNFKVTFRQKILENKQENDISAFF